MCRVFGKDVVALDALGNSSDSSPGPATRGKPDPGTGILDTGVGSFSSSLEVPEEDSEERSPPVSSAQKRLEL